MLGKKMLKEINLQINKELYSAYLYLSMAAWFEDANLKGFANWMKVQFQEEQFHALKFFDYVMERGSQVKLEAIEAPETKWENPAAAFKQVLEHEQYVTSRIHGLVKLAREENDYASEAFLQWFVTEQVEEEANAVELLEKLKMIGERGSGLLMLDHKLAARTFNA